MKDTVVIYHRGCADGFAAAWICYSPLGDSVEYIPASYGSEPPDVTGKRVYVVDFSYTREQLIKMHEQATEIVVLDHHKTAKERLEGLDFCHFDMARSGAAMAWDYFFGDGSERSWIVDYVQDRDLWKFELPHSREVNAYLQIAEHDFEIWTRIESEGVEEAVERGSVVLATQRHYVETTAEMDARMVRFAGYTVPAVNAPYWQGSELLERLSLTPVAPKAGMKWREAREAVGAVQPPFSIGWHVIGDGGYVYQLRSRKQKDGVAFDVSQLAKRYGGGGHHEAAGFKAEGLVHLDKQLDSTRQWAYDIIDRALEQAGAKGQADRSEGTVVAFIADEVALELAKFEMPHLEVEAIAKSFHFHYERLAPDFGYETKAETARTWSDIPEDHPNKQLMRATIGAVLEGL
jgi:hypothetical protein